MATQALVHPQESVWSDEIMTTCLETLSNTMCCSKAPTRSCSYYIACNPVGLKAFAMLLTAHAMSSMVIKYIGHTAYEV